MKPNRPSLAALALVTGLGSFPITSPVILIGSGAFLTGCSTSSTSSANVAQAISDARAVVQGVSDSYTALKTLYPAAVSPAVDAQVRALLASAPGILSQLSATADAATDASGLRQVETIVNGVLNIAANALAKVPNVAPNILLGFRAATVLLPFIEAAANTLVPAPATVGAAPVRFRSSMSVAEARAALGK